MGNPPDVIAARSQDRPLSLQNLNSFSFVNDEISNLDNQYARLVKSRILELNHSLPEIGVTARRAGQSVYDSIDTLQEAVAAYTGTADYGNNSPGSQLRQFAMLAEADLGTQLGLCGMGGYDLHSNIGQIEGSQANNLSRVDQAIGAFASDMKRLGKWNDTCIVVYTEFGRTRIQNGGAGLDHGKGHSELIIGGNVNGGVRGSSYSNGELNEGVGDDNPRNDWIEVNTHFQNIRKEVLSFLDLSSKDVFGEYEEKSLNLF